MAPIRLADLEKPLEPVVLPSGREVKVLRINGVVTELRQKFRETGDDAILWEAVGHLLPDAPKEEVLELSVEQCAAVIQIASGNADAIEAEIVEEAKKKRESEGNQGATAAQKPKARRRGTGSAS